MTSPLFAPDDRAAPRDDRPRPAPAAVGLAPGDPVLGYVSAPTGLDGAGVRASTRRIQAACDRAGWRLIDTFHDPAGPPTTNRPALVSALEQIADGTARGLVVSHARLLGSSVTDLALILSWFRDARAVFVALDLGLDTSTPMGRRMAVAMIRLSGWDRGMVVNGSRGKRDTPTWRADHRDLFARVLVMQEDEMSLQEIADRLNADGVPTMNGGDRWWPSSVRTALRYARGASVKPADLLPSLEERMRS
jgi:hypothetical protein